MSELVPGIRRLRPDDHFMILSETDASPMHIGALVMLQVPRGRKDEFHDEIRTHLAHRLAGTPLQMRLMQAPEGYDSDVWVDAGSIDLDTHVVRVDADLDDAKLRSFVAEQSMVRLDMTGPPFHILVFDRLRGDRAALYVKIHHAVADGVGFQSLLELLSDAAPETAQQATVPAPPAAAAWRELSDAYFDAQAAVVSDHAERRKWALAALEARKADPTKARARTPTLRLSGPTSTQRRYATLGLPLPRLKVVGAMLGATINDMLLALVSTALRRHLLELDDLPDAPIVSNSARSYRRPEHGLFGNRISAQHPHLATTLADPVERLRAIQASMRNEQDRAPFDVAMLDQPEKPFGARDRRAKFAARLADGKGLLPGNLTLSNVPGPTGPVSYAGFRQLANYPVPIIGSGRFLNVTSRRYADMLDVGVMSDPTRLPDVERLAGFIAEALDTYEIAVAQAVR